MSNVSIFNPSKAPAFVKRGELSDIAKALAGSGSDAIKRISTKGGVFRLMHGSKEITSIDERFLDVVIVKAAPKVSRTFYMKAYDGETASAPDCWSADGDTPDPKSANKQAATCASCPQNIAGSGNGQSRACRYSQRLAVVLASDMEGDVLQLSLPATSIFGKENGDDRPLQAYARFLVAQGVDPGTVITRMKFDTKAEFAKLFFKPMRWLTDDEFEMANRQKDTPEAQRAVETSFGDGAAKPAPMQLPGAKPKAQAAVVVEEDDEPPAPPPKAKKAKPEKAETTLEGEADEPAVKKSAEKPSAVPVKKDLASIVADWDDE